MSGEADGDFLAWSGRAPDGNLDVPLQNHVAAKRAGEFHLGENGMGANEQKDGKKGAHGKVGTEPVRGWDG